MVSCFNPAHDGFACQPKERVLKAVYIPLEESELDPAKRRYREQSELLCSVPSVDNDTSASAITQETSSHMLILPRVSPVVTRPVTLLAEAAAIFTSLGW